MNINFNSYAPSLDSTLLLIIQIILHHFGPNTQQNKVLKKDISALFVGARAAKSAGQLISILFRILGMFSHCSRMFLESLIDMLVAGTM